MAELADDFFESDLPFKVDIVDWATTGERFHKVIEAQCVVLQLSERHGEAQPRKQAGLHQQNEKIISFSCEKFFLRS
jgi:hypothetical protein